VKEGIHPEWYAEARVTCACGNTWLTGSTVAEIKTDVCSACHPFYTGEQRIVDTEGQVDRFLKRLQAREQIIAAQAEEQESGTSLDLPISELEIGGRNENILIEAGIETAGDVLNKLAESGDDGLLLIKGFGAKGLVTLKKNMRARGFELPED
jgi:large subunit ribosomal protein L31